VGAAEVPKTIVSFSHDVRNGRDAACPSDSCSDRTSVRTVSVARATRVQTFFSRMGSPSALAHSPGYPSTQSGWGRQERSSTNTLQSCDVPAEMAPAFIGTIHQAQLIPRHLNLGEVQPHTLRRLSNFELDRGVREQLQKVRRTRIEGART
jgi:hypothetical protein